MTAPIPYLAGLTRFDIERDRNNHYLYPVLPENPGVAHAMVNLTGRRPAEEDYLTAPAEYRQALCGAKLKVILPTRFIPADPSACRTCRDIAVERLATRQAAELTRPFQIPANL